MFVSKSCILVWELMNNGTRAQCCRYIDEDANLSQKHYNPLRYSLSCLRPDFYLLPNTVTFYIPHVCVECLDNKPSIHTSRRISHSSKLPRLPPMTNLLSLVAIRRHCLGELVPQGWIFCGKLNKVRLH